VRALVDESLPVELAVALALPDAKTVAQLGWQGIKNGVLLERAAAFGFTVLLTADQHLHEQQDLRSFQLGVIVLQARSNRMEHLEPLVRAILQALPIIRPGQVMRLVA
jgi:hypothetical protein